MSSILIAGGVVVKEANLVRGSGKNIQCPTLPSKIRGASMVLHNGAILLCGGMVKTHSPEFEQKCWQLDHGSWLEHSTLNQGRLFASAVTTSKATFIFGGIYNPTYEYLLKGSDTWQLGSTKIPEKFEIGCAVEVKADQEIWLIGGRNTDRRILSFNVNEHTFRELSLKLMVERWGHQCAFIPGTNKLMISGGWDEYEDMRNRDPMRSSTEIITFEDGGFFHTVSNPMNIGRYLHGIGVITIDDEDKLAVFGGELDNWKAINNLEIFNTQTQKWEITDRMNHKVNYFGFLTVKNGTILGAES